MSQPVPPHDDDPSPHEVLVPLSSRGRELLELVRRHGVLRVADTAAHLGVSQETVRRELRRLEAHSLIRRSYGLAFPVESSAYESRLTERSDIFAEEKYRLAVEAARRLGDARTVFIDEGFQTLLLARELAPNHPLTVLTPSLPLATELSQREGMTVIVLGGRVRGNTLGVVDGWATDMLATHRIDLAYIGANGVSVVDGLTTPDPAVARVKGMAVERSRRRIFLGAHHKFGVTTFVRFAQLDDFEAMVTGTELPAARAREFQTAGAQIVRV